MNTVPDQDSIREQIKLSARDQAYLGAMENPSHQSVVRNPFCGDEILAAIKLDSVGTIEEIKAQVRGCLVARAAWSMLAPKLQGLTVPEALNLIRLIQSELGSENGDLKFTPLPSPLSSLLAYRLPSPRHSCATLGGDAVLKALQTEN